MARFPCLTSLCIKLKWWRLCCCVGITSGTSGRRILTTGRIAGADFFHGGKVIVTPSVGSNVVGCRLQQLRWFRYWFLLRSTQQRLAMFSVGRITPNIAFFCVRIWTPSNTRFLGLTRVTYPKRHLDRLNRFTGLTNVTNRHAHRQTTLLRLS